MALPCCDESLHRSVAQKADIIDTFYQRYQDRVVENPNGHAMDYVHIYVVCTKQPN